MIKIFDKENLLFESSEQFTSFDLIKSPFKEVLKKEDYSAFSFIRKDEEEKIDFDQVFILQINIKDSASLVCAFPLENLNRGELINKIASLKSIKVTDLDSSKHKSEELLKIVKEYNPFFLVYQEKNGFPLNLDELKEMIATLEFGEDVSVFFINKDAAFDEPVKEEKQKEEKPVKENKKEESVATDNKKASKLKNYLSMDLENIKKNKYHFIFLVVSSFLFGFASSVGFCNAMIGKLITILFFVCAAVGLFLNTYVYLDFFRERKIKDRLFIYSIIFNILGVGIAIGSTMLFYYFDNTGVKEAVDVKLLAGISIAMSLGSIALAIGLAYLISIIERNLKAKKLESKPVEETPSEQQVEENKEEAPIEEPVEEKKE